MTLPSVPGASPPPRPDPGSERTRTRERKALWWGFTLSLFIHVVAVILYPVVMDSTAPDPVSPADDTPDDVALDFEVITFREVIDQDPTEIPTPDAPTAEPTEEPDVPLPTPAPPIDLPPVDLPPVDDVMVEDPEEIEDSNEAEEEEDLRTLAERLQPGMGDPRLWSFLLPDQSDLSDAERATLLLEGMLHQFNDSVAVAAALAGDAQDWTYTDEDGRRWGLSPGTLHLGDFSIPLPIYFEVPPGLSNEFGRRNWEIDDIMRGVNQAQIRETWSQRAREIRERMDAERDRRRSGGGG